MIESTVTQSASKLFEALERLGQSSGSGLTSGGPSGPPSDELIKQFQEALDSFSAEAGQGQNLQGSQNTEGANAIGQGVDAASASGVEGVDSLTAVDGIGQSAQVDPGPAERMPPVEETPDAIQVEYVVEDGSGGVSRLHSLADASSPSAAPDSVSSVRSGSNVAGDFAFTDSSELGPVRTRVTHERTLNIPDAEKVGSPERTYETASNEPSNQEDLLREVGQILEKVTQPGGAILPTDLYRLQYLTGILKVGAQTGLKASQQTTQGMESVLKQNG